MGKAKARKIKQPKSQLQKIAKGLPQKVSRGRGRSRKYPKEDVVSPYFNNEASVAENAPLSSPAQPLVEENLTPDGPKSRKDEKKVSEQEQRKHNRFTNTLKDFAAACTALPLESWEAFRVDDRSCCGLCGELVEGLELLKAHVQKHFFLKCLLCNRSFNQLELFKSHMQHHSSRILKKRTVPVSSAIPINGNVSRKPLSQKMKIPWESAAALGDDDVVMDTAGVDSNKVDQELNIVIKDSSCVVAKTGLDSPSDDLGMQQLPSTVPQSPSPSSANPSSCSLDLKDEKMSRKTKMNLEDEPAVLVPVGTPTKALNTKKDPTLVLSNVEQVGKSILEEDITKNMSSGPQPRSSTKSPTQSVGKKKKFGKKSKLVEKANIEVEPVVVEPVGASTRDLNTKKDLTLVISNVEQVGKPVLEECVQRNPSCGKWPSTGPQRKPRSSTKPRSQADGKKKSGRKSKLVQKLNIKVEPAVVEPVGVSTRALNTKKDQTLVPSNVKQVGKSVSCQKWPSTGPQPKPRSSIKSPSPAGVQNEKMDLESPTVPEENSSVVRVGRSMPVIDCPPDSIEHYSSQPLPPLMNKRNQCLIPVTNRSVLTPGKPPVCPICNFQSRNIAALCKHNRQYHKMKSCLCHNDCYNNSLKKGAKTPEDVPITKLPSDECNPKTDMRSVKDHSYYRSVRDIRKRAVEVTNLDSESECPATKQPSIYSNTEPIICDDSSDSCVVIIDPPKKMPTPIVLAEQCSKSKHGKHGICGNQVSCSLKTTAGNDHVQKLPDPVIANMKARRRCLAEDENSDGKFSVLDDPKDGAVVEIEENSSKSIKRGAKRIASGSAKKYKANIRTSALDFNEPSAKKRKSNASQSIKTLKTPVKNKTSSRKSCNRQLVSRKELKSLYQGLPKSFMNTEDVLLYETKRTRNSASSKERSDLNVSVTCIDSEPNVEKNRIHNFEKLSTLKFLVTLHVDKNKTVPSAARLRIDVLRRPANETMNIPRIVISGEGFKILSWVVEPTSRTAKSCANDQAWMTLLNYHGAPESSVLSKSDENHSLEEAAGGSSLADFEVVNILTQFSESMMECHESETAESRKCRDPLSISYERGPEYIASFGFWGAFDDPSTPVNDRHLNVNFDYNMFLSRIPTTPALLLEDVPELVEDQWIVSHLFFRQFGHLTDRVFVFTNRQSYLNHLKSKDSPINVPGFEVVDDYTYVCYFRKGDHITIIPVKFKELDQKSISPMHIDHNTQMSLTDAAVFTPAPFLGSNCFPTDFPTDSSHLSMSVTSELLESYDTREENEGIIDPETDMLHGRWMELTKENEKPQEMNGKDMETGDSALQELDNVAKEEILKVVPKKTEGMITTDERQSPGLVNGTMKAINIEEAGLNVTPCLYSESFLDNGNLSTSSNSDNKSGHRGVNYRIDEVELAVGTPKQVYKKKYAPSNVSGTHDAYKSNKQKRQWEILENILANIDKLPTPNEVLSQGHKIPRIAKKACLPIHKEFSTPIGNDADPPPIERRTGNINQQLQSTSSQRKESGILRKIPMEEEISPIQEATPQPCCSSFISAMSPGIREEHFMRERKGTGSPCPVQGKSKSHKLHHLYKNHPEQSERPCVPEGHTKRSLGVSSYALHRMNVDKYPVHVDSGSLSRVQYIKHEENLNGGFQKRMILATEDEDLFDHKYCRTESLSPSSGSVSSDRMDFAHHEGRHSPLYAAQHPWKCNDSTCSTSSEDSRSLGDLLHSLPRRGTPLPFSREKCDSSASSSCMSDRTVDRASSPNFSDDYNSY